MKGFLLLAAVTVILGFMLLSCGSSSSIITGCDDFSKQKNISKNVEIIQGNELSVYLCSNPTTGFGWSESANISNASVLKQVSHVSITPKEKGLVGAAGQELWKFRATSKGTAVLKMEYSRPWQGGEKAEWTFTLTVVVK